MFTIFVKNGPNITNTTSKILARSLSLTSTRPSQGNLVQLEVNDKTGIALLTLNRPPVNSLNLELLTEISNTLDEVGKNRAKGLIISTSSKSVFSAGLDIMEMYKPDINRLKSFWSALQDVWLKLYGSAYPTAAAISGHAPAGGCLISLSCEYRAMCPNYTIGLNETRLGIIAPTWFQASMRNVISVRETEKALTLGTMYTTDEALKIGMIDEVAADKADAIANCEAFIKQFTGIPTAARSLTKLGLRRRDLEQLTKNKEADIDLTVGLLTQPPVQKAIESYLEALKKKQKS